MKSTSLIKLTDLFIYETFICKILFSLNTKDENKFTSFKLKLKFKVIICHDKLIILLSTINIINLTQKFYHDDTASCDTPFFQSVRIFNQHKTALKQSSAKHLSDC